MPAAYGAVTGVPEPLVHDEFSYLLGADTFARGRLTNPAPVLPEFFEAPHILVVPSYSSKYPPAQALILALGQVVTGRPIWGVWLSCGLFAASLCWMLQAWSSRQWALAITVLMVVTLGMSTYWAQSYWGGMLAASGGALLFGGLRRTLIIPNILDSILMAVGVLILANTRPYEGLLACVLPAAVLGKWLLRGGRSSPAEKLKFFVLPVGGLLLVGAGLMGLHNRAVTGDIQTTPYRLHTEQYLHGGLFLLSPLREPQRRPAEHVARFYRHYESAPVADATLMRRTKRRLASAGAPFGIVLGRRPPRYQGVLAWLAVLISVWAARLKRIFVITGILVLAGECLLWWKSPLYLAVLAALVSTAWITTFLATFERNRWGLFMIAGITIVMLGQSLVWWWWSHYSAPIVPLFLAAVATSTQRVARRSGALLTSRRLGRGLLVVLMIHVITVGLMWGRVGKLSADAPQSPPQSRANVRHELVDQGGRHLVFVRYNEDFTVEEEWVYNPADLKAAPVVFAHDLGSRKNRELIALYPERSLWIVTVSRYATRLEPYTSVSRRNRSALDSGSVWRLTLKLGDARACDAQG